jgi:hypothetical protein
MRRRLFTLVFPALVMTAVSVRAETLCEQVRRYEQAPFAQASSPDGLPDRWVEVHWVGFWMDFDRGFGKSCVHSDDAESRDLCAWLVKHSSTEFPEYLPFRILECYGYGFPRPYPEWSQWKTRIKIVSERWLTLDVDLTGWKSETGAIRLSVYTDEDWSVGRERPPLAPLPESAQSARPVGPPQ